jgi:NAD(P)-dependent dehydrogenase (short-subunit alcohol dehydrogenase family)
VNQIDLNGHVAVVTGGAQGIGQAIVERLAASGATVEIWDLDPDMGAETAAAIGRQARPGRHPRHLRRDRRSKRAELGVPDP